LALAPVVLAAGGSPAQARARDTDHDGLSNRYELKRSKTSVRRKDTDRDMLGDGFEVRSSRTSPRRKDTDRDGLSDGLEVKRYHTSPKKADTDGDGATDGAEILVGTNPLAAPTTQALLEDPPLPVDPPLPPILDIFPPETTITSGPSGTVTTGSASFAFTSSEAGSTFECRLDSGAWGSCTSPKSYASLSNGSHTFRVRATDANGNTDPSAASRTWTVNAPPPDTTPPNTSISSGPSGTVANSSASFDFTSTEAGSTFQCRLDGGAWGSCSSPKSYSGLANGSHTFDVRATDGAGNTDATPASRTWTVNVTAPDTTPPDTSITGGPSGTVSSTSASLDFTSTESGSTFQCRLDGGSWASCSSPKAYSGLTEGSHTFDVRATDVAGNTDASPASRSWTVSSGGGGTCTQTLSPGANVALAVSSAANGSTICLNNGSYGSVNASNASRSGWVTVRSVSGTGASLSGVQIGNSDFIEFQSLTIGGGLVNNCSTHVHFLDSAFTDGLLFTNNGVSCPAGQDYLVDNSTFNNVGQATYEGRLNFVSVDGGTIQNSTFSGVGSEASDGIQFLGGTKNSAITGNHFTGIKESLCGSVHCDAVQFYGAGANNAITDNYFEQGDTFIMAPDGTSTTSVTDNVFNGTGVSYIDKIQFGSATSPVFRHNTVRDVRVSFDSKTGSPATTNLVAKDNILIGNSSFKTTNGNGCSACSISSNLFDDSGSATGSGNVIGTPTFTGGANPSAYSGYKLASGSVGKNAASDGNDMGALVP
jgi:Bacterial TSP3 repeat